MSEESSGGSSFDGNVIIKQVGEVPVNSRVSTDEETWGIPVDVNTSHRSYIKHAAMHLFAAAPLIETDDKGNIKYVGEAKVRLIAKECIKDAYILHDELHAYKSKGGGSGDDGSGSGNSGGGNGGSGSGSSGDGSSSNKTKAELEEEVKDLTDANKVNEAYIKLLEDALITSNEYVKNLENALNENGIELPKKPTIDEIGESGKEALPTKPTIDDINKDDDKPDEDDSKMNDITQIPNVVPNSKK